MLHISAIDDFSDLRNAVEEHGHSARLTYDDEYCYGLNCLSGRSADGSTSFIVFRNSDYWYLTNYTYLCWPVPLDAPIKELCIEWLDARSDPGCIPDELVGKYGLREKHDRHEYLPRVFAEVCIPVSLRRIHAAQEKYREFSHRYAGSLDELSKNLGPVRWYLEDLFSIEMWADGASWNASILDEHCGRVYEIDHTGDHRVRDT